MIITLNPAPLVHKKLFRDGFYVEQREDRYYMGHQHGMAGNTHKVRVSEEFYLQFIIESQRNTEKYEKLIKPDDNP